MITTESAMTQKFRGFSHSRNHHAIAAVIRGKSPRKIRSPPEQAHGITLLASLAGVQADQDNIRGPNCVRRTVHA